VEASNLLPQVPLAVWAGARMYRGDDIYLLDFWPLDSLNTYGGGVAVRPGRSEAAVHVGMNRLDGDDFQVQTVTLAVPDGVAGEEVLFLDDNRLNVDGARSCGIEAVCVRGVGEARQALAMRGLLRD